MVRLSVEEVRRHPPTVQESTVADPAVQVHRVNGEFHLGAQSFGITDSLTLLYSHRHFHKTAQIQAQRAALQDRPFAVIVARLTDIDQINRTRGFAAGDHALQSVALVFQQAAARCQGQAYRASGRRLALIGPSLDEDRATQTAHAVRHAVRDADATTNVGMAIGVSAWRPGDNGEDVIRRALEAAESMLTVRS